MRLGRRIVGFAFGPGIIDHENFHAVGQRRFDRFETANADKDIRARLDRIGGYLLRLATDFLPQHFLTAHDGHLTRPLGKIEFDTHRLRNGHAVKIDIPRGVKGGLHGPGRRQYQRIFGRIVGLAGDHPASVFGHHPRHRHAVALGL